MFQSFFPRLETLMVGTGAFRIGVGSGVGDLGLLELEVGSVSISEGTDISSVLANVE